MGVHEQWCGPRLKRLQKEQFGQGLNFFTICLALIMTIGYSRKIFHYSYKTTFMTAYFLLLAH